MPKRLHALADPQRAEAYLAALDETRSLTAAACAVGLHYTSVAQFRRRNPAFEERVKATLGRPVDYDGRQKTCTHAQRCRFLDALAQSGCARTAADAAGIASSTLYRHRSRDMAFAAGWAAARDEAADRAFGRLLHQAIHGFERTETIGGVEKRVVSHEAATVLKLLARHDAQRPKQPGTGRFVEITPERVAQARTTLLRRLTDGGSLTTMAEAIAEAAATPATPATTPA